MCTLTYRLTEQGYQIFFNRDEQITRPQAIPPTIDCTLNAAYPVDPTGGGTWIAVHESGISLALLNYYQAQIDPSLKSFISRGVIIPQLLKQPDNIHQQLLSMDFSRYQAFQLCVFYSDLSVQSEKRQAYQYVWNGRSLSFSTISTENSLPITSSGVDYELVSHYRKQQFNALIDINNSTSQDYVDYHQHQGPSGKCSVKMHREDARTVSFTQITVDQTKSLGKRVSIEYQDYLSAQSKSSQGLTL